MKELFEIVEVRNRRPDLPYCLATVVSVAGSSYRRPGARMLVDAHGRVAGSVSGGCLEKDVIARCHQVLLSEEPILTTYDTTDQDDWAMGTSLGCEGTIQILIEPLLPKKSWPLGEKVMAIRATRQETAWNTIILPPGKVESEADGISHRSMPARVLTDDGSSAELRELTDEVLRKRRKTFTSQIKLPQSFVPALILTERLAPEPQLILLGGGWDAPPLVRLARELGYQITVIDRREAFSQLPSFPGANTVSRIDPPHDGKPSPLSQISEDSAVVIMNHHYDSDLAWFRFFARRKVAYLGILGPKKRTDRMIGELKSRGEWPENGCLESMLCGPAGLDIGSESPEQIALAILAEIQAVQAGRKGGFLRDKGAPIHS